MNFIAGKYHIGLVFLSVLVPVCLSMMALHTANIALNTNNNKYRHIAIFMGGLSLGGGIWAMHFIGMMAFILPVPVHYDIPITIISLLPGWAAAWLTMYMLARRNISYGLLIISAVLMGAGIGTMHYIGMAAMITPLQMRYKLDLFVLSIVVAVLLAMVAIWIQFGLNKTRLNPKYRFILSGVIMGIAISGMHYTGMSSVRFIGTATSSLGKFWVDSSYIALVLASLAITIGVMVAAINAMVHSRELLRQIRVGKSRLQAILDTAIDAIITIDAYGNIQEFSRAAEKLFGYKAAEVIGKNVKILMPEPYHSEHDGYLKNYRDTGKAKIIGTGKEVVGKRKDGSTMPIRLAVGQVDTPDNTMLFVGLLADISEKKRLESSLRDAANQARQAAAAKTSFLANMSHEIRTPMNSIIGFTDLVLQTDLSANQKNYLNTIKQSSRNLLRLINDILDTTKIEHGRMLLEIKDFSLKSLAMQIESSLKLGAQAKGLYLNTYYPVEMPQFFKGDQLRLLQIFTNLVGNAIKFTEKGGIDVIYDYVDEKIHVQVKDTGIGMSADQIKTIFDPFTQADASISRRFGGTGLGTTIALQLTQTMGGEIKVASEIGRCSTFHVYLPLPLGEKIADTAKYQLDLKLPALKILIADDVEQNLELLRLTLENNGHTVVCAHDGQEAFVLYKANEFDLVLMDVHMPNTDGLQASELIRTYESTNNKTRTPIIALTASVMSHDRQAASAVGMDGFAVKPLDLPSLFQEMANVLGLSHTTAAIETDDPDAENKLIDWARGIALWGNKAKLMGKIQEFLAEIENKYPIFTKDKTYTAAELREYLHSMRGVAGNLALISLSKKAGELEQLAAAGQIDEITSAITELLEIITLIKGNIDCESQSIAIKPKIKPDISAAQLQSAVQDLLAGIDHSEINDKALAIVADGMVNSGALLQAIDNFDFEQAKNILKQWQEQNV